MNISHFLQNYAKVLCEVRVTHIPVSVGRNRWCVVCGVVSALYRSCTACALHTNHARLSHAEHMHDGKLFRRPFPGYTTSPPWLFFLVWHSNNIHYSDYINIAMHDSCYLCHHKKVDTVSDN